MTRKRLFYDIETSFCNGHFWRPGYNQTIHPHQITSYAKIISIHWSWEGEDEVHHLHWGLKKQCDKKMLEKFVKQLDKATEVITHNGKRFDTPWIRTRCMFHNIPMRWEYNEVDTYKLAKKYLNLPSNSLKEVCKYFGLESKLDAGGISTWTNVVFNKDKEALDHLLYYGDGDIVSLKAVYNKFLPYVKPNVHYPVMGLGNKFDCPNCGKHAHYKIRQVTAMGSVQHWMRCSDRKVCKTQFKISNATYNKWFEWKNLNNTK